MRKYNKTIAGVLRCYKNNGMYGFAVYGKPKPQIRNGVVFISMRYNAFGIENGKIRQVKHIANAVRFPHTDLSNAQKFVELCEQMNPDYVFQIREFVKGYNNA